MYKMYRRGGRLLVIFDIPEKQLATRNRLRRQLRQWHFKQVQKSVYRSNWNYEIELKQLINELAIDDYVEIHKSRRLYP